MTRRVVPGCSILALLALLAGGCAGSVPPPVTAVEPLGVEVPETEAAVEVASIEEPEIPARERWQSPFAVSSIGRALPVENRRIVVIDADPAIAAGLAEQRAIDFSERPVVEEGNRPEPDAAPATPARANSDERPRDPSRLHQVGPGDTLLGIARRYNVSTEQIRTLNRLPDDRIRLGETLLIPPN